MGNPGETKVTLTYTTNTQLFTTQYILYLLENLPSTSTPPPPQHPPPPVVSPGETTVTLTYTDNTQFIPQYIYIYYLAVPIEK